jgi:D-alanyl-lipoteichoic acid acyltransferase DltB (MBOAT superfamily)
MNDQIGPYSVSFWWVVGLALVLVVPLKKPTARKWVLAGINLSIFMLVMTPGPRAAVVRVLQVFLLAVVANVLLSLCAGRFRKVSAALGGIVVLTLFLVHKLPWLGESLTVSPVNPLLGAIGFSYVALRLIEVGRAVYERRHQPPDLASTINYLFPFHMLVAGPIQAFDDFVAQPAIPQPLSTAQSLAAMDRIAAGVFKKYVLAQGIQQLFLTGFHASGPYLFLEVQLSYIWLYLDFSAYSDIAVGIGRLIGVATPENFNRPYLARNVIDFWERWHISLSMFIRRNVFFPIQFALMRRTSGRFPLLVASFSFTVSFLLCGLWHQVNWVWLAWGSIQAVGLIVCNIYRTVLLKRLGRKGVDRYLADPWIRLAAIILTFEFAAFAVAVVTFPFQELTWPTINRP